jgi:hypothetical protein
LLAALVVMRNQSSSSRFDGATDDREPEVGDDRLGQPQRFPEDDEDDDGDVEIGVAHRISPLPLREEEEEELSEADLLEEHDLEDLGADDLVKMEGPDA